MTRISSNRRIAEALLKTLRHLEADQTVDPQDPAFIQLKCTLLQRLLSLEINTAEIESSIHLIERRENERTGSEPAVAEADSKTDSAIA